MTRRLSNVLLMMAIVFWGILLGGIAYSHLVYFPPYLSDLPGSAVLVNGPYPLREARFWGLIHPLLILSLISALISNWSSRPRRLLIVFSLVVYVIVLVITGVYFVPELILFEHSAESTISTAEWVARGRRWQRLSWLRGFVTLLAYVPLLFALTKPASSSDLESGLIKDSPN